MNRLHPFFDGERTAAITLDGLETPVRFAVMNLPDLALPIEIHGRAIDGPLPGSTRVEILLATSTLFERFDPATGTLVAGVRLNLTSGVLEYEVELAEARVDSGCFRSTRR